MDECEYNKAASAARVTMVVGAGMVLAAFLVPAAAVPLMLIGMVFVDCSGIGLIWLRYHRHH